MARFVVELEFGENQDERMAVRPSHREYLATLVERGVLLTSGPWADQSGALLIYEVEDLAALRDVLAADPYTRAGVVRETRVREWQTVVGAWQ